MDSNKIYRLNYIIEKNIKIPEIQEFQFPFTKMEIDDSFFIPLLDWVSMGVVNRRSGFWECVQKYSPKGREYEVRTVDGGFRVWRIK
ncbi:MAG: hypothetical protein AB1401_00695 [Thermodesulfobacteriota bacterium]